MGVAGKANNKKLNDRVLFNFDFKFDHTTMENAVALPINFNANFPSIWLGKWLFSEYKWGMATAALQLFVVTDFCFPALRQDNSLYSHTLNEENGMKRNIKDKKGKQKKGKGKKTSYNCHYIDLGPVLQHNCKWLSMQWNTTCMLKESFRCFLKSKYQRKILLLSFLSTFLSTQSLETPCI